MIRDNNDQQDYGSFEPAHRNPGMGSLSLIVNKALATLPVPVVQFSPGKPGVVGAGPTAAPTKPGERGGFTPTPPTPFDNLLLGKNLPLETQKLLHSIANLEFPEPLAKAWCDSYTALGKTVVAQIDVKVAEGDFKHFNEQDKFWTDFFNNGLKDFSQYPIVPDEYIEYGLVLENAVRFFADATDAMVDILKATLGKSNDYHWFQWAANPDGLQPDLVSAEYPDVPTWRIPFVAYSDAGATGSWGSVKVAKHVQNIISAYYKLLIRKGSNGSLFDLTQITIGGSDAVSETVAKQAFFIADTLRKMTQTGTGTSGLPDWAKYAKNAQDRTKAELDAAAKSLAAANEALTLSLTEVEVTHQTVLKTLEAYLPATVSANKYINLMTDDERQQVAPEALHADVIGQSRAAVKVATIAATKAAEYSLRAKKLGGVLKAGAIGEGAGTGIEGTYEGGISLTQQQKDLQVKLDAAQAKYDDWYTQGEDLAAALADVFILQEKLSTLQAEIAIEIIQASGLADQVQALLIISASYNDDAKKRIKDIIARAAANKITLEDDAKKKLAELTAMTDQTDADNAETDKIVKWSLKVYAKVLELASQSYGFNPKLGKTLKERLHEIEEITAPPPKVSTSSSGLGLIMAALAAIALMARK